MSSLTVFGLLPVLSQLPGGLELACIESWGIQLPRLRYFVICYSLVSTDIRNFRSLHYFDYYYYYLGGYCFVGTADGNLLLYTLRKVGNEDVSCFSGFAPVVFIHRLRFFSRAVSSPTCSVMRCSCCCSAEQSEQFEAKLIHQKTLGRGLIEQLLCCASYVELCRVDRFVQKRLGKKRVTKLLVLGDSGKLMTLCG